MATIEFDNVAAIGVVQDEPPYQILPEAWSQALNVLPVDNGMIRARGWTQVFGTPGVAPHFALPILSPSQAFWLYTSLTAAYVYDGATHTNITRTVGGAYTAGATRDWNAVLFAGVPIVNNGSDVPQFWGALSTLTKLADMTNWPSTLRAKIIRAVGPYLVALNCTDSAVVYQHLVRWSQSVENPGALPASWDYGDETIDAGQYDLPDVNAGGIVEGLNLGSKLMIYKEQSTWGMRFIGGRPIFAFDTFSETAGILAPRCVAITGDGKKHIVATQDDIVVHDGTTGIVSAVNGKMRKAVFGNLDQTNYVNSFMYTDAENDTIYFVYPENGQTNPSRALAINYRTGALTEHDGITYRNAAAGRVEASSGATWTTITGTWSGTTALWSQQARRRVVLCCTDSTKFCELHSGTTRDGSAYTAILQREGLAMAGKKRTGEPVVDHEIIKYIDRVWPKIQVSTGYVKVRVGYQMHVDGPVTWGPYTNFDPATQVTVDASMSGRAVAIEFSTTGDLDWRLDGWKLAVKADAQF